MAGGVCTVSNRAGSAAGLLRHNDPYRDVKDIVDGGEHRFGFLR